MSLLKVINFQQLIHYKKIAWETELGIKSYTRFKYLVNVCICLKSKGVYDESYRC